MRLKLTKRGLNWLNLISDKSNWIKFWKNYLGVDIRTAIDKAKAKADAEGKSEK